MALTITYTGILNGRWKEYELVAISDSGRRWNIREYNGRHCLYGWVAKTYINCNPMRPNRFFNGLPELLDYLMMNDENMTLALISFWDTGD